MMRFVRTVCLLVLAATPAYADEISKEACIDSHSRGQDARDSGKLSLARKLFLTCAQAACPALVQGDCAKFANDLTAVQPTITFAARDASGSDLPDTTVYVDDVLLLTRLDGKPHDIDPGNHTIKFQNGGRDQIVTVVINSGEKGRTVVGNFPAVGGTPPTGAPPTTPGTPPPPEVSAPLGSKIMIITGGAMLVGGAALAIVGLTGIPERCELSTNQCAAPPNDPVFADAKSAVRNFNIGLIVGGVGAAALIGGIIWYAGGGDEAKPADANRTVVMPYGSPDGGGFAVSGRF